MAAPPAPVAGRDRPAGQAARGHRRADRQGARAPEGARCSACRAHARRVGGAEHRPGRRRTAAARGQRVQALESRIDRARRRAIARAAARRRRVRPARRIGRRMDAAARSAAPARPAA
ncbi:MAG: hypothetical protein MZW92_39775 [Comamonadaceae bacterium]|nr:hypothetical protein [Comamonadaceae bacterium]